MIQLKQLLKEMLLQEALPVSKAKEYTSIKRNSAIQSRLDSIFSSLSKVSNAKSSKRGDRIYIPYNASKQTSPVEQEIEKALSDKGFSIKDYTAGVAVDKYGRELKLGRVLTKLDQTDLLNKFNTDTARASSKTSDTYIVFSKHPYDIAGQSTDRDWTSCMDIYTGSKKRYVKHDVKQGTFVAYYISGTDLNINKPIGRISIKPFINIQDTDDVIYSTAGSKVYGNPPNQFSDAVDRVLNTIQKVNIGKFELQAQLYCDLSTQVIHTPNRSQLETKQQVEHVLELYEITNYTINQDLTVDVTGDVGFSNMMLDEIPVTFGKVTGNFNCSGNKLTNLEGAPKQVGGHFSCTDNNLTSLKGAPEKVEGSFNCTDNNLTSLEGAPKKVEGSFYCSRNKLSKLEGAPKQVGGLFYCYENNLTSLKGGPEKVEGSFYCSRNKLTSLEGAPKQVGEDFNCSVNKLTSLKGAPKQVGGHFYCLRNNLRELEGAPKQVGGDFNCSENSVKFTEQQVQQVSDVQGNIEV